MSVVCVLLLLVQTALVQGSCYMDSAHFDEATNSTYCVVGNNTRMEANTWYLTPDCFNCTCGDSWMSCCGVGIRAGAIRVPEGYKIQLVPPCDYIIVKDEK